MQDKIISADRLSQLSTAEQARALFSGKFQFSFSVSDWKRSHEQEYAAAKQYAAGNGLLAPAAVKPAAPQPVEKPSAAQTADAVRAFSKERCRDIFIGERKANGDNIHHER